MRVPWLLDTAVVAAGVLTIALLVFSTRITSATLDGYTGSKNDLASVKLQIGLSHVWLEEALAGDRSIHVKRDVYAKLAAAHNMCLAMRGKDPDPALSRLCTHLKSLRALAAERWKTRATATAGSRKDQRYDAAFNTSLALAGEAEHSLSKKIARARTMVNRINAGIVFGVFLIFGGMLLVVGRRVRQLAAYNERLRRLDGLKDNLMASVSHELRTPLTSTIGFLKTVERSDVDLDDETQRELIGIARVQAERLARLVDDLLFFAQVENGGIRLTRGNVDVALLADECVRAAKPLAREKGVALELIAESVPQLRADRARVAQLLDNLVSNAVKFTPPGGHVEVLVEASDADVCVRVSDSGIGIPVAEQPQLFERFFRASAAVENAIAGTGLGLPIAKAIVDAHNAAISIQSEEGRGTSVVVRFPLVASASLRANGRSRLELTERHALSRQ
ncbi:MAG TPA: ATP-binding protein [Gaiellaceae bacterium]|nr:ATP-binding protein [Gaiellaceae bacterium]